MQLVALHVAFVLLLVGTQAFFTGLSVMNVRHADRLIKHKQLWVAETLGVEDTDEIRAYHRLKTAFSELQSWIGLGALLAVLYVGGLAWSVELLFASGWSTVVQGVVFFGGLVVAAQLFSIPFSVVSTFGLEESFGFNQQTPTLFVRDQLLTLGISIVFTVILGGAVVAFISSLPTLWPLAAWVLFVGFSLVMQILYPRVIAPLFNDFEPVESGTLREAVEDVFQRADFSTSNIYTMDASKRSSQLNAYFIGFGQTKRVVLFDTLVDSMTLAELQSVLAHELAHWKRAHIWKQFAASTLRMGVVFGLLGVLVAFEPLYAAFGIPETATYAGLLLSVLIVGPILQFTAPLSNRLSLKHEREADAYAAEVMSPEAMINALGRLATENLANPFPHPWYAAFHYSHPPIPERIRLLEAHQNAQSTATEGTAPADD